MTAESRTPSRLRSYSLPDHPDSAATVSKAIVATLARSASATSGTSLVDSAGLGGRALADETAKEAIAIWCARKAELASLAKCFVSIAVKEPRKRRANGDSMEHASLVPDERFLRYELDRAIADDGLAVDQQLERIHAAAQDLLEGHRTLLRHCLLTLKGKQSKYSRGPLNGVVLTDSSGKTDVGFHRHLQVRRVNA